MKKIVAMKCPARCNIPYGEIEEDRFVQYGIEEYNYCREYKCNCAKVDNCIIKQLIKEYQGLREKLEVEK